MRRYSSVALPAALPIGLLLGICASGLAQETQPTSQPSEPVLKAGLPSQRDFHRHLKAVIRTYPTDGTHAYHWPKKGTWAGNARDLDYLGEPFAAGDPKGRCHCCGLTFEVFLQAWQRWAAAQGDPARPIPGVPDRRALRRLRTQWFGADGDRTTVLHAVESHGLGTRVRRWQDARPGDFVQLWRHSGSGHSVVFLRWEVEGNRPVAIHYWSTQKSTDGIGTRREAIHPASADGPTPRGAVDPEQIHIVRVGAPGKDAGEGSGAGGR